jgi:hypothetical protein
MEEGFYRAAKDAVFKAGQGGLSFVTTSNLIEYIGHKGNCTPVLKIKQCPPY